MHQFVDLSRFYIASDNELMIDILKGEINFLKSAWDLLGRPLVTLVLKRIHLGRSTCLSRHIYIYILFRYIHLCYIIITSINYQIPNGTTAIHVCQSYAIVSIY